WLLAPPHRPDYLPRAVSGPDGPFQFSFAPSELDADYLEVSRPAIVAVADGFGIAWADPNTNLTLKLAEDLAVEGRILNPDHHPIAGAKVRVGDVSAFPADGLTRFLRGGVDRRYASLKSCWCPPPGATSEASTSADGR